VLELGDEPVDVGVFRRRPRGWGVDAEAWEIGGDHVLAGEMRAHLVPQAVRVGNAVDEDDGHVSAIG